MAEEMQPMQAQAEPQGQPGMPQGAPGGDALTRVRKAVMLILYGEQTWEKIPAMLKGAPNAAAGIAAVTMFVMDILVKQSRGTLPQELKQPAADMLMKELMDIAGAAGLKVGHDTLNQAKSLIVQKLQAKQQGAQPAQPPQRGMLSLQAEGQA